jgi:hypothetical protein
MLNINEKALRLTATILIVILFAYALYIKIYPIIAMKKSLKKATEIFDLSIVQNCERIYRLESGNFTSSQFLGTYSAGMEPAAPSYPFGWKSLQPFWDEHTSYKPTEIKSYRETATGITKQFIKFPTVEAGVMTLCYWLTLNNNNPGRWFSTDGQNQTTYNEKISNIQPVYTNEG